MVALFMPATSPACESMTSASKPRDAAHFRYMRSSICAQSCASVPPAPAWMSRNALCESISPRNMRLNSSLRTSVSSLAASRSISVAMPSSFSLSASSSSSEALATAPMALSMSDNSVVRRARSLPSSWAISGLFQIAGSSSSRLTSSSRSFFWSYSKKPPQGRHTFLEIFELTLQHVDFHRGRTLPEGALHEYRQRVRFVGWKRRNFLESRAPIELERANADISGFEARQGQLLGARPVEQPHQHRERDTLAACLGLQVHALQLRPAATILGRAATHQLAVLLHHQKDAARRGESLRRIEMVALRRIQRGVERIELGDERAHLRVERIALADGVVSCWGRAHGIT